MGVEIVTGTDEAVTLKWSPGSAVDSKKVNAGIFQTRESRFIAFDAPNLPIESMNTHMQFYAMTKRLLIELGRGLTTIAIPMIPLSTKLYPSGGNPTQTH